jgi:hypothetical protein
MSQFEYWVAFLSILLALGLALAVAELMAGLGRIIRERETPRYLLGPNRLDGIDDCCAQPGLVVDARVD